MDTGPHEDRRQQTQDNSGAHNNSANSSMDLNSTMHGGLNNDSLEGNRADDEGDGQGASTSGAIDGKNLNRRNADELDPANRSIDTLELSQEAGFEIKPDGKSNKYPLLKVYYEFGPWVGRNRKAICVRCKHTSASSQPERLIRHLRRCAALTDEDRQVAEELLLVSNANKKKKKKRASQATDDETDFYDDQEGSVKEENESSSIIALPAGNSKRLRRDHPDRKKHIDQCLVRFIICCRIPLKSIHSKEFVEFVKSLDPEYRLPSRETITNVLIPGLLKI